MLLLVERGLLALKLALAAAVNWASHGNQRRLQSGVLLLDCDLFELTPVLGRFGARAKYCPTGMRDGAVSLGNCIASDTKKCSWAQGLYPEGVTCFSWFEEGEVSERYHVAAAVAPGEGVCLPLWSYPKRRLAPAGLRACRITAGKRTYDLTREAKGMTATRGSNVTLEVAVYLVLQLKLQKEGGRRAALPVLTDCKVSIEPKSVRLKNARV